MTLLIYSKGQLQLSERRHLASLWYYHFLLTVLTVQYDNSKYNEKAFYCASRNTPRLNKVHTQEKVKNSVYKIT